MLHLLIFTIGLIIGAIISIIITSVLIAGGRSDDRQEAYNYGFKNGKEFILEKIKSEEKLND